MGLFEYVGFVALSVVVAVAVERYQPSVVDQVARQTGVDGWAGWTVFVGGVLWVFLPALAGAEVGEGRAWLFGAALAGGGCYLLVVAAGSLEEYRLLSGVEGVDPSGATAGETVAVTGEPSVDGTARTPFTGVPAVHTDWLVQRRGRTGFRRTWTALESGVESTGFALGDGAVRVTPGDHRVFSDAERWPVFDPGEALPDRAATFLDRHGALPDPDDREQPLRFLETFVPAEEPVTVVGTPRQGGKPGTLVVDEAPPDELPGTGDDAATGKAVLVRGDADAAETMLRRRVFWLGPAGLAMVLGGQALSFVLSTASPGGLL
jgi:hypothetical protein